MSEQHLLEKPLLQVLPKKKQDQKSVLSSGRTRGPRELIHDVVARQEVPASFHQRQDQKSVLTSGTTRGPRELIHDVAARHEVPASFHLRYDTRSLRVKT